MLGEPIADGRQPTGQVIGVYDQPCHTAGFLLAQKVQQER